MSIWPSSGLSKAGYSEWEGRSFYGARENCMQSDVGPHGPEKQVMPRSDGQGKQVLWALSAECFTILPQVLLWMSMGEH